MIKAVIITTQQPRGDDPGACEIGYYKVENGFVLMCDENGRATGKKCQLIGEDAHRVAGRLLRETWAKRTGTSDFNRPLVYPERRWK
jgi:hypothetical protein